MSAILDYKCPNCGGAIKFNPEGQNFQCESCDSIFTKEDLESYAQKLDAGIAAASEESSFSWQAKNDAEAFEGMSSYNCNSCGAEIVVPQTASATSCPYCGSPIVLAGQLSGMNRPDCVIPFKLSKDAAKAALRKFYEGKFLLPKIFKSENKLKEMQSIYVPFWLFDCDADANIVFQGTRTRHWSTSQYNYTETSYYHVFRSGSLSFANIPADGSSKMDDAYMEGVEPYDYFEMKDFDPAYLSGFLADKYDVDAEASFPRIEKRVETSVTEEFASTVSGYETLIPKYTNVKTSNGSYRYALLPVWMLITKYKGKNYQFAVNGQTGKLSGTLPIDKLKRALLFGGICAAVMAIAQFFIF